MIIPLGDRIYLEVPEVSKETPMGIILVDVEKNKRKTTIGTAVAIGPDVKTVKPGDRIIFPNYAVNEIDIDENKVFTISEPLVLAKVE